MYKKSVAYECCDAHVSSVATWAMQSDRVGALEVQGTGVAARDQKETDKRIGCA